MRNKNFRTKNSSKSYKVLISLEIRTELSSPKKCLFELNLSEKVFKSSQSVYQASEKQIKEE